MSSLTVSIVQAAYDFALKRRETHDLFYREMYRDDLARMESLGAAGIEGGRGDAAADEDGESFGGKVYSQLYDALADAFQINRNGNVQRKVLELGAGTGYLSCMMAGPNLHAHLVDKEPLAIAVSERIALLHDKVPFVRTSCADLFTLDESDSAEIVFSIGVFEELNPAQHSAFLKIGTRLTKPGGLFLIGIPNFISPIMIEIWWRLGKANELYLTRHYLRQLFERAGFQDVHVAGAGSVIPKPQLYWADKHLSRWLGMLTLVWGTRPPEDDRKSTRATTTGH